MQYDVIAFDDVRIMQYDVIFVHYEFDGVSYRRADDMMLHGMLQKCRQYHRTSTVLLHASPNLIELRAVRII